MKKTILLIIICISFFKPFSVLGQDNKLSLDEYINRSDDYEYGGFDVSEDIKNSPGLFEKIVSTIMDTLFGEYKNYINILILIIFVCIITSLVNSFTSSDSIKKAVNYCSVILCSFGISNWFKIISDTGFKVIDDLTDYMKLTFPGMAYLLAGSGYESSSVVMNGTFVITSNIFAVLINKIITPAIYAGAILAISNGICCSEEINKTLKTVIKFVKYSMGLMLTVFTAVLTLTGFAATTSDSILIKTAKYAISSFVPIVGGCLSDTLNSLIVTSSATKNTLGYVGVITLFIIFLVPVLKVYFMSFITKMLCVITNVLGNENFSKMTDIISDITGLIGAVIVFLTIIYILMFGIAISVGG